jgi:hypothetical protein
VLLGDLDAKNSGLTGWRAYVEKVLGSSTPTSEMMESLIELVKYLNESYGIRYLGGHKEFHAVLNPQMENAGDGRNCPGDLGIQIVEDLRKITKLKSPSQMTPTDKTWYNK